jgi:CubicO group peptidase (beta-lactamase class C family)
MESRDMTEPSEAVRQASDRIDAFLQAERERCPIPGLSLGIVWNGELLQTREDGFANIETETPVSGDSVYQIGSITKQFTASALLLLAYDSGIDLDGSVLDLLPDAPASWKPITLRHLLTHTSGLPEVTELKRFDYQTRYSQETMLDLLRSYPADFAPGERWKYSNTGYVLIGWIIERISGMSFHDFLSSRLWQPLGMRETRVIRNGDVVRGRVSGYLRKEGKWLNGEPSRPSVIDGAGGMLSTVGDLAVWDAALREKRPPLTEELLKAAWTPARLRDGSPATTSVSCGDRYGLGWFIGEHKGRPTVTHTGETDAGFSSEILRFEEGWTFLLLSNLRGIDQDRILKTIADFVLEP